MAAMWFWLLHISRFLLLILKEWPSRPISWHGLLVVRQWMGLESGGLEDCLGGEMEGWKDGEIVWDVEGWRSEGMGSCLGRNRRMEMWLGMGTRMDKGKAALQDEQQAERWLGQPF